MGKLNLLHHKSYHPYKFDNVQKVLRDEAAAKLIEEESDRKSMVADSEARLDRMRIKSRKKSSTREGQGEGEKELANQLSGKKVQERQEGGSRIIRSDRKGKGREVEGEMGPPESKQQSGGHINFWSEFEAGGKTTAVNLEAAIEKSKEAEKWTDLTKVYLAKKGEGDPKGWYASEDGKSEQERKEGVEGNLERAYKDGEHKRLSDPLAMMNSYLQRRTDIMTGAPIRPAYPSSNSNRSNNHERYPSATPNSSNGGDLSPIITSLLAPRRRKGEAPVPIPPTSHSTSTSSHHSRPPPPTSSSSSSTLTIQSESLSRTSTERSRAQALIAASRRAARSSSSSSTSSTINTPGSVSSMNDSGFGLFNKEATREAGERRRGGWGGAGGEGRGNGGGGWMERKEERRGRESNNGVNRWGGR